jgi:hypothetical protein
MQFMHGFKDRRADNRVGETFSSRAPRARELGRALILLGLGGSSIGGFVAAVALASRAWGR